MSHLQKSLMKKPILPPSRPLKRKEQPKDFTPQTWEKYFTEYKDIELNSNKFRVYLCGTEGPTLVLLHGGGYSGLTWSLFTKEISKRIQCKILAIDIRGHGETHTNDDEDLSIDTLSTDILDVLNNLYTASEAIIFIGHSMGGALAAHCAHNLQNCVGLVVIDVVEGTAMDSLSSMQTFLKNRPNTFMSIEHAIQWCYRSSQTLNLESARVSMPGQIKNTLTGKLAASELADMAPLLTVDACVIQEQLSKQTPCGIETISEESGENTNENNEDPPPKRNEDHRKMNEDQAKTNDTIVSNEGDEHKANDTSSTSMAPPQNSYAWRINLSKTEVHWKGWFQGLSELFLNTSAPKLLLLANIAGLDTSLTVGQMQGKFQMVVLPRCGHAIHEDLPETVADTIATYLVRQKVTTALCDFTHVLPGC